MTHRARIDGAGAIGAPTNPSYNFESMDIVNIAAYKFIDLPDTASLREPMRNFCLDLGLKGTILLAPEGINFVLAGTSDSVDAFLSFLAEALIFGGRFEGLSVKRSLSARQPFRRMLVRLKKEIIRMNRAMITAQHTRAPTIDPKGLCSWLDRGRDDDGRPIVLLDTRNEFEVELGSFQGAMQLHLSHFGEFPRAIERFVELRRSELENATIVAFCTGGIRCEKAALVMRELGLPRIRQLEGGILHYFEQVGSNHWQGECFVFDDRVALDPMLRETATTQCYACRQVLTADEQIDARYVRGISCPRCWTESATQSA